VPWSRPEVLRLRLRKVFQLLLDVFVTKVEPVLFTNKTGWLGVDIGTHAVKIAQVRRRSAGFELSAATIVARTDSWCGERLQGEQPAASADEIRAGLSAGESFVGRQSACALSMAVTEYQHLQSPAATEKEQLRAVSQHVGQGGSRGEFDFWALPGEAAGQRGPDPGLQIVSLPPGWPQQVVRDHAAAGLRCRVLDALPMVIARAVQMSDAAAGRGVVAAVDWGVSTITLCMVHDGRPALVRSFREGCLGDLVEAIRRALPVSAAEAHKLLVEVGLPGPNGDDAQDPVAALVAEAARPALDQFQQELQKTFAFWENSQRQVSPHVIQLLGGGATIRHIEPHLEAKLKLPVTVWRLKRSDPGQPSTVPTPDPLLATAIGLSALKGWKS
jgi:Tfp pilus assembly PilM family ATPase